MDGNVEEERFSRIVSTILDYNGYSIQNIQSRRFFMRERSRHFDEANENLRFFTCGSLNEGIVPFDQHNESDGPGLDVFGVAKVIICADESDEFEDLNGVTVLQIERGPEVTSGGYVWLRPVRINGLFLRNRLFKAVQVFQEHMLLSSQMFLRSREEHGRNGSFETNRPEHELIRSTEFSHMDRIFSFQGFLPTVLRKWKSRPRRSWPSTEDIRRISSAEAMIVPSDSRTSPDKHVEWRVSFTKAENILMLSLNPTFLKVYVLLRMLFKGRRGVTSYHIKTALFWTTETTPTSCLHDGLLIAHVVRVLHFLRSCLQDWYLPNYFNSSWNVLAGCTTSHRLEMLSYIKRLPLYRRGMVLGIRDLSNYFAVLYKQPKREERDSIKEELEEWLSSQPKRLC